MDIQDLDSDGDDEEAEDEVDRDIDTSLDPEFKLALAQANARSWQRHTTQLADAPRRAAAAAFNAAKSNRKLKLHTWT